MVSFVGADDAGNGNIDPITITWPTVQAGDVALLWWIMTSSGTAPTSPTGFTLQQSVTGDTGTTLMRFEAAVLTGSESGSLNLTAGAFNRHSAVMSVYRGCHLSSPIDTWAVRDEDTSATTHANPQVTTGYANCAIATAIGERSGTGTNAWTPPTGYTERADSLATATGTGGTICACADDGLAVSRSAGTNVTPPVWTSGNTFASVNVLTWTVSLRPLDPSRPPYLVASRAAVQRAASW